MKVIDDSGVFAYCGKQVLAELLYRDCLDNKPSVTLECCCDNMVAHFGQSGFSCILDYAIFLPFNPSSDLDQ
jgi:hypothetical protein